MNIVICDDDDKVIKKCSECMQECIVGKVKN